MSRLAILAFVFLAAAGSARADDARVERVLIEPQGALHRFSVTLRHGDTGWDDYSNGWRVVTGGGEVIGTRELLHPHADEQPFTRSLGGVRIPDDVTEVYIETRTSRTGWVRDARPVSVPE